MPRTCLGCSHPEREAIDKALVAGEPLRNIAKRVSISPAALVRHKSHVAGTLVKAQERREVKLGDSIFDEIRRLQAEVRECLVSLNGLLTKAESGPGGIVVELKSVSNVEME
jgi:hypothetical protein